MSANETEYKRLQRVSRQMTILIWAARLLRALSGLSVLLGVGVIFLLGNSRTSANGLSSACGLTLSVGVTVLLLWALAAQFESTVAILEDQHDIRLRLDKQDRMLRAIGKATQAKDDTQPVKPFARLDR